MTFMPRIWMDVRVSLAAADFTHSGLVEGHYPASNAYSIVRVNATDCSITVQGYGASHPNQLPLELEPYSCTVLT